VNRWWRFSYTCIFLSHIQDEAHRHFARPRDLVRHFPGSIIHIFGRWASKDMASHCREGGPHIQSMLSSIGTIVVNANLVLSSLNRSKPILAISSSSNSSHQIIPLYEPSTNILASHMNSLERARSDSHVRPLIYTSRFRQLLTLSPSRISPRRCHSGESSKMENPHKRLRPHLLLLLGAWIMHQLRHGWRYQSREFTVMASRVVLLTHCRMPMCLSPSKRKLPCSPNICFNQATHFHRKLAHHHHHLRRSQVQRHPQQQRPVKHRPRRRQKPTKSRHSRLVL